MKENSFVVDARTIFQLGKEAIENEQLAVSEIVKNSYDADASFCEIKFANEDVFGKKEIVTQISFLDDGCGMSIDEVRNNWLRIGTSNKLEAPYTKNGRRKIGEKGIGRLALNRLGNLVKIFTKKDDELGVYFEIDFNKFINGIDLSEIPITVKNISIEEIQKQDIKGTGTKIVIEGLLDVWSLESVKTIIFETTKLQAPYTEYSLRGKNEIYYFTDSEVKDLLKENFEIKVSHPFKIEVTEEELQLKKYLKYSLFRMQAIVDTVNNTYNYTYSFHPYHSMGRLNDKQTLDNEDNVKILDVSKKGSKLLEDSEDLGLIIIELFAYDFSSLVNQLSPFRRITPLKSVVKTSGGVKVYRDNQRVFNYGEPGNDWLELDSKRINRPGRFLSNNVLIGTVNLDRESSSGLKEKTNREGFVENLYSKKFKKIVQAIVFDFSQMVEQDKYQIKKHYGKEKKRIVSDEVVDSLVLKIDSLKDVISQKDSEELTEGVYLCKAQMDYIKDLLVNVSINAMDFYGIFHDLEKSLEHLSKRLHEETRSIEILENIESVIGLVKGQNDLLRDKTKKVYNCNELLESILYRKRFQLKRENVELQMKLEMSSNYYGKFNKSSIIRIIDNLLNNSIYWMQAQNSEKKIMISTKVEQEELLIYFDDSGPGFKGDTEYLKEPFISSKIENEGIGLGLFIVEELMKDHSGRIECNNESDVKLGSARVELTFQNVSYKGENNAK